MNFIDFARNKLAALPSTLFRDVLLKQMMTFYGNRIQIIGGDVFLSSSLTQIYLFRNQLVNLSFESFATTANFEIHLYGNNVTFITGKADKEANASRVLYVNCDYLHEIQKVNARMTCVSSTNVPEIRLNRTDPVEMYVAWLLRFEGFVCYMDVTTQSTICTICPQGTYANGDNECMYCPEGGFYQDQIGATTDYFGYMKCRNCSAGTYVKDGGGTSQEDCIHCPDGTNSSMHAGFRACFCSNGYARRDRFEGCYLCRQPGLKCTGQDFESLKPGYYWNWSFPNANMSKYNAFVHNLLDLTLWYDDHTQYYEEIPRVYKCPRPASCMSDLRQKESVETICSKQYQGWLCSKCKNGFHLVFNMCLLCPDGKIILLEVLLLICFVALLCYIIWWKYKEQSNENYERHTADVFVSRMKLALGFYQVIGEYVVSFKDVSLGGTVHLIGEIISVIRLNILKFFLRPQCISGRFAINPKVEFIFAMIALFAFTALPFIFYQIIKVSFKVRHSIMVSKGRLTNLRAKTFTFVIIVLFITYPPICTSVFQLYPGACQTFCLDLNNAHCFTVLRSDNDVSCDDHFKLYQVFAVIASIGYVLTFPLILLFMLWKCFLKSVYLSEDKNRPEMRIDRKVESMPPLSNHSDQCRLPLYLKFLCENYKPHYWYWEIVELARKVTQTVLITLLGWDNKFTVLLTIGISVLFLTLHARHRPMKSVREQHLQQMFSLAAILTNVVFFAVEVPDKYNDALSWFLVFLNISVLVFIILEVFVTVLVEMKNKLLHAPSSKCYPAEKRSLSSTKMLTEKA
ncbi:hypothetical protein HOLleu_06416 [Holothuria leucospilota]|uniref:Tyrosine-protein kinase ephrin type A/B receptor-like domain-containing protein n=1 Tax=Holothuria leucospilota TaxID=206669 RepID=A0A9Q1CM37_HOLLE|nr:hypothetical protein HOLleu_06416 [Holothuria leucospilota]